MNSIKNKKILLIGGSGFIGLHLAKKLSEFNADITMLCKNPDKIKKLDFSKKISILKGDVTDYKTVEKSIKNKYVIINLASIVYANSNFDPYIDLETNCKGQLNILEARKKSNLNSKYISIGSRAQFGSIYQSRTPSIMEA